MLVNCTRAACAELSQNGFRWHARRKQGKQLDKRRTHSGFRTSEKLVDVAFARLFDTRRARARAPIWPTNLHIDVIFVTRRPFVHARISSVARIYRERASTIFVRRAKAHATLESPACHAESFLTSTSHVTRRSDDDTYSVTEQLIKRENVSLRYEYPEKLELSRPHGRF